MRVVPSEAVSAAERAGDAGTADGKPSLQWAPVQELTTPPDDKGNAAG